MLSTYRHGALYVVENAADKDWIDRLLRQLDPRLFCELQVTLDQEYVWCAVLNLGDRPPFTVLEFRDPDGTPIPMLTERIVDEVKAALQRGPDHVEKLKAQGEAERARRDQDLADALADSARDFEKAKTRLPVFPRSPALTATRRKMRREGKAGGPEL